MLCRAAGALGVAHDEAARDQRRHFGGRWESTALDNAAALLLAVAQGFALRALAANARTAQRLGVRLAAGLAFQAAEPEVATASQACWTVEVEAAVAAAAAM